MRAGVTTQLQPPTLHLPARCFGPNVMMAVFERNLRAKCKHSRKAAAVPALHIRGMLLATPAAAAHINKQHWQDAIMGTLDAVSSTTVTFVARASEAP